MSVQLAWRVARADGAYRTTLTQLVAYDYTLPSAPDAIGVAELVFPYDAAPWLDQDARLEPWRSIDGGPWYQDNSAVFLVETLRYKAGHIRVTAYGAKTIAARRVVAYAAGSSYADKGAAPADTQLLTFASEQLGTGIVAASRDGDDVQANVSSSLAIAASPGQGASVAKAAARRVLHDVAAELCQASTTAGTYLTYDIIGTGAGGLLLLRTWAICRGVDRSGTLTLSEARGTLEDAELTLDYHDQATATIAGGSGDKADRLIRTASDLSRIAQSPFGRIERFVDMSNVDDPTTLQDDADAALWQARPRLALTGTLRETDGCVRGVQVDLGDIVRAEHAAAPGQSFLMRIDAVRERGEGGTRACTLTLRSVT